MAVRVVPNPVGIALLARTPFMSNAMMERGNAVAETAASIGPVGDGAVEGHYVDQIKAVPLVALGVAGSRVNAYKFTSGFIEFGTSDTPAFAPLRTACDAVGLTLSGGRQS